MAILWGWSWKKLFHNHILFPIKLEFPTCGIRFSVDKNVLHLLDANKSFYQQSAQPLVRGEATPIRKVSASHIFDDSDRYYY